MLRLVLVDDLLVVRQGLRMRLSLEPDITVVGEASNGREYPKECCRYAE